MTLEAHLAACEADYSPEAQMVGRRLKSAGYHTALADGTRVHGTRQSLDYALALLASGQPPHVERACAVVRKVLTLQDTDPLSRTYGIWPYFLEEPLSRMAPPDWNWADFCGALLAMMLHGHADKLPADLAADMRASLGHAAWSVFRRNVGPGYTNIAVMGAGVTLAAGEILGSPRLADYGRRRLAAFCRHTQHHGGFNEYNSPCYTVVALHECERILQLVRDPVAREDAEAIRRLAWATIAEHFHPATGQWAGPHSRAYSDLLPRRTARYIAAQTGIAIGLASPEDAREDYAPLEHLPCPPEMAERFGTLPEAPMTVRRRFIRGDDDESSVWGTTWLGAGACLGSVSRDLLWTQRRPLIAYWRTRNAPAVVLRLRFLHDGRDFASAIVRSVQCEGRVLSLIGLATDRGDWHPGLDRPTEACFEAEDFRVRYELSAPFARGKAQGEGRFELAAGHYGAVIHTAPGRFGPHEVAWHLEEGKEIVRVDGVCYSGPRKTFHLPSLGKVFIAAGLELLPASEPVATDPVALAEPDDRHVRASWDLSCPLAVAAPSHPEPFA